MYFEQKIVNGILCHRSDPKGEWIKYSPEDLTGMLENYHKLRWSLMDTLETCKNIQKLTYYENLKNQAIQLISIIYTLPY